MYQYKAEIVWSTVVPRGSCSELVRSQGYYPTLRPLGVKCPLLICRVIWSECGLDVRVGHRERPVTWGGGDGPLEKQTICKC